MATRLYLHNATSAIANLPTAEQSTLASANDFEANQATNREMTRTKGTSQTSLANASTASTSLTNYYIARWVSPPFTAAPNIIAATWTLNFAAAESDANANFPVSGTNQTLHVHLYVWRPGTGKIGNSIIDGVSNAVYDEPSSPGTEKSMHGTFAGGPVMGPTVGDVLVLEMWARVTQAVAASYTQTVYFDGTLTTFTENTTVTSHASFLETSLELTFPTRLYLQAVSSPVPNLPSTGQSTLASGNDFEANQFPNRLMSPAIGTAQASLVNASTATMSSTNYYVGRWATLPLLGIATISANTWTLNFAAAQSNVSANFPVGGANRSINVNAYVWRPRTQTKVGTILDGTTAAVYDEPAASTETSMHGTFSGSAVSGVQDGDVVVFEMWLVVAQAAAASYTQTIYFGGGTVTTTKNITVSDHASFLETPQTLVFGGCNACLPVLDVTKPPYNAVPDVAGGGDAIQSAIDDFCDNPGKCHAIFIPHGVYKLTRPLLIGRSNDFVKVNIISEADSFGTTPGIPRLTGAIIEQTVDPNLPVVFIQGARAVSFHHIGFRGSNTGPFTQMSTNLKKIWEMADADWVAGGARTNEWSPQACIVIDPFMAGPYPGYGVQYPNNAIANCYPGYETYYGGVDFPVPLSSSQVNCYGCTFSDSVVGVVVSPAGPATPLPYETVQNAENFLFDCCLFLFNREGYAQCQGQSRSNELRSCRMGNCRIGIDTQNYGTGGSQGTTPYLTGAPQFGNVVYMFNVNHALQRFSCQNIYCEATMSLGFLGHGNISTYCGSVFTGCTFTFATAPVDYQTSRHLRAWGPVRFDGCMFAYDGASPEPLKFDVVEGPLAFDDCQFEVTPTTYVSSGVTFNMMQVGFSSIVPSDSSISPSHVSMNRVHAFYGGVGTSQVNPLEGMQEALVGGGTIGESVTITADALNQMQLTTALVAGVSTTVVVNAIPANTPQTGFLRVERDSDGKYDLVQYSSWTGSTFTLVGTAPSAASIGNDVYRAGIMQFTTSVPSILRIGDLLSLTNNSPTAFTPPGPFGQSVSVNAYFGPLGRITAIIGNDVTISGVSPEARAALSAHSVRLRARRWFAGPGGSLRTSVFRPESYGAIGDGAVDDTQALRRCIDSARFSKGIVELGNKQYRITEALDIGLGQVTIRGTGWVSNVQELFSTGSTTYTQYNPPDSPSAYSLHVSGSVILADGCDGFVRTDSNACISARFEKFALVSKGAVTKTAFKFGEGMSNATADFKYVDVGVFRWSVGFDMSLQYNASWINCRATGCQEGFRGGISGQDSSGGNAVFVDKANIESCDTSIALYSGTRIHFQDVLSQNYKTFLRLVDQNGAARSLSRVCVNDVYLESTFNPNKPFVFDDSGVSGSSATVQDVTLTRWNIQGADVAAFDFGTGAGGLSALASFLLEHIDTSGLIASQTFPSYVQQVQMIGGRWTAVTVSGAPFVIIGTFISNFNGTGQYVPNFWTNASFVPGTTHQIESAGSVKFGGDVNIAQQIIAGTWPVRIPRDDASTNTVLELLGLRRTSSGSPAAGIGMKVPFEVEGAGGTVKAAELETSLSSVTSGNEVADFILRVWYGGAQRDRIKIVGDLYTVWKAFSGDTLDLVAYTTNAMRFQNLLKLAFGSINDHILMDMNTGRLSIGWAESGETVAERLQIQDHSGYAKSGLKVRTGAIKTTNATQSTNASLTITLEDTYIAQLTAHVVCHSATSTVHGVFAKRVKAWRAGGGANLGTVISLHADDIVGAGLAVTWTASGNDVRVSVSGLAATDIYWVAHIEYQGVKTDA
jgi:hypothetical protein